MNFANNEEEANNSESETEIPVWKVQPVCDTRCHVAHVTFLSAIRGGPIESLMINKQTIPSIS